MSKKMNNTSISSSDKNNEQIQKKNQNFKGNNDSKGEVLYNKENLKENNERKRV